MESPIKELVNLYESITTAPHYDDSFRREFGAVKNILDKLSNSSDVDFGYIEFLKTRINDINNQMLITHYNRLFDDEMNNYDCSTSFIDLSKSYEVDANVQPDVEHVQPDVEHVQPDEIKKCNFIRDCIKYKSICSKKITYYLRLCCKNKSNQFEHTSFLEIWVNRFTEFIEKQINKRLTETELENYIATSGRLPEERLCTIFQFRDANESTRCELFEAKCVEALLLIISIPFYSDQIKNSESCYLYSLSSELLKKVYCDVIDLYKRFFNKLTEHEGSLSTNFLNAIATDHKPIGPEFVHIKFNF